MLDIARARRTDVLSPEQRSKCMSRNRGRDTAPEVRLRVHCWALGLRYRLHAKLPGRPDFVFPSAKVAVFVDGCFWHGCPIHYQSPASRARFWQLKMRANRRRDEVVNQLLETGGWRVVRIWEHEVKANATTAAKGIRRVVRARIAKLSRADARLRAQRSSRPTRRPAADSALHQMIKLHRSN